MRRLAAALLVLAGCSAGVDRHFFVQTDDGALLKVHVQGNLDSGVLILLLHGGPSGSSHIYNSGAWSSDLEDRYAIAYLDQRAQGASQGAIDTDAYGVDRAALDVEQVLAVLRGRFGSDKALYLLGHSWGGQLGTKALIDTDVRWELSGWIEAAGCHDNQREPVYVSQRMVEVGTAEIEAGNNVEDWTEIVDLAEGVLDSESITYDQLIDLNRSGFRAERLVEDIEWSYNLGEALGSAFTDQERTLTQLWAGNLALYNLGDEALETAFTDRLDEIELPSVFLYAAYDFVCPVQLGRDASERVSNAERELVVFEASGHSLMYNEPAAFVSSVVDFVERTR
jgi:pimeloyl-ACP methyl ester carboxylesterase